jgi:RNA polymerase sigma factor (sigma-70 family)
MFVTAANHIKDEWKKKSALPMSSLDREGDPFDAPDEKIDFESQSEFNIVKEHMLKLSDNDREILTLRYIEGLTPSDIAEIMKIRENTISVRINRAVFRLKEIVTNNGKFY